MSGNKKSLLVFDFDGVNKVLWSRNMLSVLQRHTSTLGFKLTQRASDLDTE